jgi:surface antigen
MNIQNLTDDVLCAYLDGELSPEARAALERQLPGEPGARVRLDRLRESDDRLRRAFALPSAAATDPLVRLLTSDAPADNVVPMRASRLRRVAAPLGLALAATVAGLAIGFGMRGAVDAPAAKAAASSSLAISNSLHDALDRNASGQPRAGVTVVLTFRRENGALCRQFEVVDGAGSAEGVACRSADKRWQVSGWHEMPRDVGGYRTAAGDESPIEAMVDVLDASGPLSPEEEAQAIRRGW